MDTEIQLYFESIKYKKLPQGEKEWWPVTF